MQEIQKTSTQAESQPKGKLLTDIKELSVRIFSSVFKKKSEYLFLETSQGDIESEGTLKLNLPKTHLLFYHLWIYLNFIICVVGNLTYAYYFSQFRKVTDFVIAAIMAINILIYIYGLLALKEKCYAKQKIFTILYDFVIFFTAFFAFLVGHLSDYFTSSYAAAFFSTVIYCSLKLRVKCRELKKIFKIRRKLIAEFAL